MPSTYYVTSWLKVQKPPFIDVLGNRVLKKRFIKNFATFQENIWVSSNTNEVIRTVLNSCFLQKDFTHTYWQNIRCKGRK